MISGDFNFSDIHWTDGSFELKPGMSNQVETFHRFMSERFLSNHIDKPTMENNTLDLILLNVPEWFAYCNVENNVKFSDHKIITCNPTISLDDQKSSSDNELVNLYSTNLPLLKWIDSDPQTWEFYNDLLNQVTWNEVSEGLDIDSKVLLLTELIEEVSNETFNKKDPPKHPTIPTTTKII